MKHMRKLTENDVQQLADAIMVALGEINKDQHKHLLAMAIITVCMKLALADIPEEKKTASVLMSEGSAVLGDLLTLLVEMAEAGTSVHRIDPATE